MVETQVVWAAPMDPTTISEVDNKAQLMASLETQPFAASFDPGSERIIVSRFWVDSAAATEWVSFVTTFDPISANIVE
jgi:hypothetical protein